MPIAGEVTTKLLDGMTRLGNGRAGGGTLSGSAVAGHAQLRQATPFLAAMLAGVAAVHLQTDRAESSALTIALAIGAVLIASVPLVPWDRLPSLATVMLPLLLLGVVAFLRETTGDTQALTPLILLPILWLALYDSRLGVALGIAAVALALFLPLVATTGAEVTSDDRRTADMWLLVAAFTGAAVNGLARDLRARTVALERTSRLDPLTGLQNRRALEFQLPLEIDRGRALEYPVCVAMLDLDHFKLYNDRFGHQAGDALLKEVCRAWRDCLRAHDTLVRYGGEEFCAILPNVALDSAHRITDRFHAAMPEGQTVSIGMAQIDDHELPATTLARADAALLRDQVRRPLANGRSPRHDGREQRLDSEAACARPRSRDRLAARPTPRRRASGPRACRAWGVAARAAPEALCR
jgi:diguanylate cyclase (GGDEF)-like protein